ncbi:MAG TPA: hypothetical protein VFW11_23410 [Cyclobacteriaceae bacterium]|nr:hypothetical protein [Cyclobacteriaceae bacterium]
MQEEISLSATLTNIAKAWDKAAVTPYPEKQNWIRNALANVYALNSKWYLEKLPQEVPLWKEWLNATAAGVEKNFNSIVTYVNSTLSWSEIQWISEDYQSLLNLNMLRSQIAFLIDTYREFLDDSQISAFELDAFDERLRNLGDASNLPERLIPDGLPRTHWWWHTFQDPEH